MKRLTMRRRCESRVKTTKKLAVLEQMVESGVLPVFRTQNVRHLIPASRAIGEAGIGCVEYTLTMPDALGLIRKARNELPDTVIIGAGTVTDARTAKKAVQAGAQFIASPGCDPGMIRACKELGILSIVGALTPTEIMNAQRLGADVIKVFPATSVGPDFFLEIQGPIPGVILMAAGGMSPANLKDYFAKGAQIVTCLGNGLGGDAYQAGRLQEIKRAARVWVQAAQRAQRALANI